MFTLGRAPPEAVIGQGPKKGNPPDGGYHCCRWAQAFLCLLKPKPAKPTLSNAYFGSGTVPADWSTADPIAWLIAHLQIRNQADDKTPKLAQDRCTAGISLQTEGKGYGKAKLLGIQTLRKATKRRQGS
jgi:hypothetical protein